MHLGPEWARQLAGVNVGVQRALYKKLRAEVIATGVNAAELDARVKSFEAPGLPPVVCFLLAIAIEHTKACGLDTTNAAVNASVPFLKPATRLA